MLRRRALSKKGARRRPFRDTGWAGQVSRPGAGVLGRLAVGEFMSGPRRLRRRRRCHEDPHHRLAIFRSRSRRILCVRMGEKVPVRGVVRLPAVPLPAATNSPAGSNKFPCRPLPDLNRKPLIKRVLLPMNREIFGPESIFLPERREGAAKRGRPKAPSSRLRSRGWRSARSWHGRGSRS